MEDNNSPYIYEKPLRATRSKKLATVASVGLFAVGTAIGSSAFGSTLGITENSSDLGANSDAAVAEPIDALTPGDDPINGDSTNVAETVRPAKIVRTPLRKVSPKTSNVSLALPDPANAGFSNLSSATPSAGGSSGSVTLPSQGGSGYSNVSSATPSAGGGSSSSGGSSHERGESHDGDDSYERDGDDDDSYERDGDDD